MYIEQVSSWVAEKSIHPLKSKVWDCKVTVSRSRSKKVALELSSSGFKEPPEELKEITLTFLDKKGNIIGKDKWRALIKKKHFAEQSKTLTTFFSGWYCFGFDIDIDLSKSVSAPPKK